MGTKQKYDRERYIEEPGEIDAMLRRYFGGRPPSVVFDVGACEGEDSIRYARLFPEATVYAFEPLPKNFERVRENVARHPELRIEPRMLALSDREGTATFHVSSGTPPGKEDVENWDFGNKSSSLREPDLATRQTPWLRFEETIEVETATLEGFCQREGIGQVDFIHLDVQGCELDVLRHGGAVLDTVRAVWMEVASAPLYKGQPLADDVAGFMSGAHFFLAKDTLSRVAGDHLYVRERLSLKQRVLAALDEASTRVLGRLGGRRA